MVLTGNENDVQAVMHVIEGIDRLSASTQPGIHLVPLKFSGSSNLAEQVNSIYDRISEFGGRISQRANHVTVIPVPEPNSLLIVAPEVELESVKELISQLDRPIQAGAGLQVIPLENASAIQTAMTVNELLGPQSEQRKVAVTADVRTNSIIVQAPPNEITKLTELVNKLDADGSHSVLEVKIIPLKHAVASELADVLSNALLTFLGEASAQTGAQQPGTSRSSELSEMKSTVLQLLSKDDTVSEELKSGALQDIHVSFDHRTNSLILSAPKISMPLMNRLIETLDQPTPVVSEIKVFTLANADAIAMVELLERLFAAQIDLQVNAVRPVGAVSADSEIVPLTFSVDVRTNSILASGSADSLQVVEAILLRLDQSDSRKQKTKVFKLKNSPAVEVALAVNEFLSWQRELIQIDPTLVSTLELLEREVIVVPEPVSNSLIISSTERYYDEIVSMIDELDAAPPQVVIQALLVEVELDNDDEFGVEVGIQDSVLFDRSVVNNIVTLTETITNPNGVQTTTQRPISQEATPGFLFNNSPLGNNTAIHPSALGTQGLSNFSLGRVNGDLGFGGFVLSASSESGQCFDSSVSGAQKCTCAESAPDSNPRQSTGADSSGAAGSRRRRGQCQRHRVGQSDHSPRAGRNYSHGHSSNHSAGGHRDGSDR